MEVASCVIPCLDVHDGWVVRGVNFRDLEDAGDPVELATRYGVEGADELIFLDISTSVQSREITREMVTRCAETMFVPLTVGGRVRSVADVDALLCCGTDRASINTGAPTDPGVIDGIAARFGNQVLVLSLGARRADWAPSGFEVTTHGGRRPASRDAIEQAKEAMDRGVREALLNSMGADSTTDGFGIGVIRAVRAVVDVPLIASGRAGTTAHSVEAAHAGADVMLTVSVSHRGRLTIAGVRQELAQTGSEVRGV